MRRRTAAARGARVALHRALDAAHFGPVRTLDLRASMPTPDEAVRRAEPWLRERQMAKAGTLLIITGRGKGSPDGEPVVQPAIARLLGVLKRKGVVSHFGMHTPGSFEVTLAPIRALFESMPRSRGREASDLPAVPTELQALRADTRRELRALAERSLDELGAPRTEGFISDEMRRHFAILSGAIAADETDRDSRLQFLIAAASDAFDSH